MPSVDLYRRKIESSSRLFMISINPKAGTVSVPLPGHDHSSELRAEKDIRKKRNEHGFDPGFQR